MMIDQLNCMEIHEPDHTFVLYLNLEVSSKNKEEELSSIIVELRKNLSSAQEKLAREQADKMVRWEFVKQSSLETLCLPQF